MTFVFCNIRFLLLFSLILLKVYQFNLFKDEGESIKSFTELFFIFNFLLNIPNDLTMSHCGFISALFNSHETNKLTFSITVKSPFKVVKQKPFSESEESGVAMPLTASATLHIFCLLPQQHEKCRTL